jgi:hypothetical protein
MTGKKGLYAVGRRVLDVSGRKLVGGISVFSVKTCDFANFLKGGKFFEKSPSFSGSKTAISIKIDNTLRAKSDAPQFFFIPFAAATYRNQDKFCR